MPVQWTAEQKAAIESRGGTLLLSAAAGSGKTAVLSERAVSRMLDPENPVPADRLLIVTFTRAAAREMKERILLKLGERIAAEPGNELARRQRTLCDRAQISTIHAFCFDLIRENFQLLDLPPVFRIGDEEEIRALSDEVLGEVLEAGYASGEAAFLDLAELLSSGSGDQKLAETVKRVLAFARSHPFYRDWLLEKLEYYRAADDPANSVWAGILFGFAKESADYALSVCEKGLNLLSADEKLQNAYGPAFLADRALLLSLRPLLAGRDWDGAAGLLAQYVPERLRAVRGESAEKERAKAARGTVREAIEQLRDTVFSASLRDFSEDLEDLLPKTEELFRLALRYDGALGGRKAELGLLDFSDLEQLTLELLLRKEDGEIRKTPLAAQVAGRFDEIMVDECQDLSGAQDKIFEAISNGGNLFEVGDVKQSVYRFRQARPELFLEKKERFFQYGDGRFPALITLGHNFRSRKEVTGAVNFFFSRLMSKRAGEIDYGADEALYPAAEYPPAAGAGCEVRVLELTRDGDSEEKSDLEEEAAYVASLVAELTGGGVLVSEGGALRPAAPRDICILLRSPGSRAAAFRKALSKRGIGCRAELTGGFLTTGEITAALNFLRAAENPVLDLPLAGAMLSPAGGFTDDELAKIRVRFRSGGLYAALCAAAQAGDGKCGAFLSLLAALRAAAATGGAAQVILLLYEKTGFPLLVRAMENGEQRYRNLILLPDYAEHYRELGFESLSAFLGVIDRTLERGEDLAPAAAGETADSVVITSIHRSKGLEYPIVIVADTSHTHTFAANDLRAPTLLHSELGFASVRRDRALRKQFATVPLTAMRLETQRAAVSEELRVLYVAMTRAKERLILVSSQRKPAEKLRSLLAEPDECGRLPSQAVQNGKSYADWILSAALLRDGAAGRLLAGEDFVAEGFSVRFCALAREQAGGGEAEAIAPKTPARREDVELLVRSFSWEYPFPAAMATPAKLSVSEVVRKAQAERWFSARPAFLERQALSPAERGSAVHLFMQLCDFSLAARDPEREIERLRDGGFLTGRQADAVDAEKIRAFFSSALSQRINRAGRVLREFRFMAPASASALASGYLAEGGEGAMLQGIADCILIEGDRAAVVDFKTDHISSPQALRERYAAQLFLYRDMLSGVLGVPVAEGILYSFHLGSEIQVF